MNQPLFIYADYLPTTTVIATDTAAGYSAASVLQAHEDTSHKFADDNGTKTLTFDLTAPLSRGAVAIAGEYLAGITLEIRASTDNFVASDVQVSAPAVISTPVTAYRLWENTSYRYWRLVFTDLGASTEIYHAAIQQQALLPFMEDGFDPDSYKTDGSQLIAVDGHYLGAIQTRTLREQSLEFGQVTDDEALLFQRWADACIKTIQGFFFIPDTAEATCHFGWVDAKYVFKSQRKLGLREIGAIPFRARVV